jgi:Double-GTPase 1
MRLVLLGEQATGKSSLLVALYGALVNRESGELRLARTIDDVELLTRGLESFGRHESLGRTEVDGDSQLVVELLRGERTVTLEVPDRSGETLRHMLDARAWDPDLREQIDRAGGALLFFHPDRMSPPEQADDAPWTPAHMPSDVRAVDLLQAILDVRPEPLAIAVIVSAWDLVDRSSPRRWLEQHAPLLAQFLSNYPDRLPHAVFGVSAQGGDFSAGEAGDEADPWERAYVALPDSERGTLAAPILWFLDAVS